MSKETNYKKVSLPSQFVERMNNVRKETINEHGCTTMLSFIVKGMTEYINTICKEK